jgi:hypothetical protein
MYSGSCFTVLEGVLKTKGEERTEKHIPFLEIEIYILSNRNDER